MSQREKSAFGAPVAMLIRSHSLLNIFRPFGPSGITLMAKKKRATGSKAAPPKPAKKPDAPPKAKAAAAPLTPEGKKRFPVVGLGASAGGVEAVIDFFRHMKTDSGMAFAVVMHLDP